ncbi:unnamed protein product [Alternaria burnsii]|nr:unnamed protein product [Alternaria burnsii]
MCYEHIASSSSSTIPFDFRSVLADFEIPEHQPSTLEQNSSTPDIDVDQDASTTATSSGTVKEDNAIQYFLRLKFSPEQIIKFAKTHKDSKEYGHDEALEIISGVETEELPERIRTVKARLLSAATMSSPIPTAATLPTTATLPTSTTVSTPTTVTTPTTVLTPATVFTSATVPTPGTIITSVIIPTPTCINREQFEAFDAEPAPQGIKRPRIDSMNGELASTAEPQATNAPKTKKARKLDRRGCPDNNWKCVPEETKGRAKWTSMVQFKKHYKTYHLGEGNKHEDGDRLRCLLCDHDTFSQEGCALVEHIWHAHLV